MIHLITHLILQFVSKWLEAILLFGMGLFAFWRLSVKSRQESFAKKILEKNRDSGLDEPISLHPVIDASLCAGCAACVKVCPEGNILQMIKNKAVLVSPAKCVGHGECERACPMDAISLVFGTQTKGLDIPRLTKEYETNVEGLYIVGELGGMGLIRNAVKQGVIASTHAVNHLPPARNSAQFDLLIVGAGPAGLASALAAIANKKSYLLIEQNSFGGTVANFPRQKIVMSYPAELPIFGPMKFNKNRISKEELLQYWNKVRQKAGIKISERTKFKGVQKKGDHFLVTTDKGELTATKVILATGVRGSPRRLGLPNEDLSKVTYNLLDPDSYREKQICIVGGGNAGVEAAQMLSHPKLRNKVTLVVREADLNRANDENRAKLTTQLSRGELALWFKSQVKVIEKEFLIINKEDSEVKLENDYLFIFAGAEMPQKFLMDLGIQIDKKFGEGLTG